MPTIRKRGKIWYIDYRIDGKRVKRSIGPSKRVAELELKKIEAKLSQGELSRLDKQYKTLWGRPGQAIGLKEGVEAIFGIPGSSILPFYSALRQSMKIKHYLARHEEGASHAADGYARVSGKVGVCSGTSGPAGTNMVTGLYAAKVDSIPIIAITGQNVRAQLGKDAFQAVDIAEIVKPVTKKSYCVKETEQVPSWVLSEAFRPIIIIVINNGYLSLIRQVEKYTYDMKFEVETWYQEHLIDFVKFAEAYGAYGELVEKPQEIKPALQRAVDSNRPAVIEIIVERETDASMGVALDKVKEYEPLPEEVTVAAAA